MGSKTYQWTNATKNGFLNDELDALWAAINSLSSGGSAEYPSFDTSAAHGFAVGQFVGINSSGEWALAGGDTGIQAIARIVSVPTSTSFTAAGPGLHAISNSESVGRHWLSTTTPGDTQTSQPIGGDWQLVMVVISSSYVVLFPTEMIA